MKLGLFLLLVFATLCAAQDSAMVEVGTASTINMAAAAPMREIAQLLVDASNSIAQLSTPNVAHHHVSIERHDHIVPLKFVPLPQPPAPQVSATLVPRLAQPTIHDPTKWGTKHPLRDSAKFVDAAIVGEDGKPYIPRKSTGITEETADGPSSPFRKFVFPPKVGASADVENVDSNINLTREEFKRVNGLQKKLKSLLDRLGANIVFDHSKVKNRKYVAEFNRVKAEARALMEEYELRTGVKTIAWTLAEPNEAGLVEPTPKIKDIFLKNQKHLQNRPLQRSSGAFKVSPDKPVPNAALPRGVAAALAGKPPPVNGNNPVAPPVASPRTTQRIDVSLARTKSGKLKADVKLKLHTKKLAAIPGFKNMQARPDAPLIISVKGGAQGEKVVPGRIWEVKDPNIEQNKKEEERKAALKQQIKDFEAQQKQQEQQ